MAWPTAACARHAAIAAAAKISEILLQLLLLRTEWGAITDRCLDLGDGQKVLLSCAVIVPQALLLSMDCKVQAKLGQIIRCWRLLDGQGLDGTVVLRTAALQKGPNNLLVLHPVGPKFLCILVAEKDC